MIKSCARSASANPSFDVRFAPKADNDGSAAHYLIAACPAPDAATGLRDRAVVQGRGDRSSHRMRRIDKNARLFAFIG
jgi:hypothetical protein